MLNLCKIMSKTEPAGASMHKFDISFNTNNTADYALRGFIKIF